MSGILIKSLMAIETVHAGKWFAEEERKLSEAVYRLSGASPGEHHHADVVKLVDLD
jgi:hypothetical protein